MTETPDASLCRIKKARRRQSEGRSKCLSEGMRDKGYIRVESGIMVKWRGDVAIKEGPCVARGMMIRPELFPTSMSERIQSISRHTQQTHTHGHTDNALKGSLSTSLGNASHLHQHDHNNDNDIGDRHR